MRPIITPAPHGPAACRYFTTHFPSPSGEGIGERGYLTLVLVLRRPRRRLPRGWGGLPSRRGSRLGARLGLPLAGRRSAPLGLRPLAQWPEHAAKHVAGGVGIAAARRGVALAIVARLGVTPARAGLAAAWRHPAVVGTVALAAPARTRGTRLLAPAPRPGRSGDFGRFASIVGRLAPGGGALRLARRLATLHARVLAWPRPPGRRSRDGRPVVMGDLRHGVAGGEPHPGVPRHARLALHPRPHLDRARVAGGPRVGRIRDAQRAGLLRHEVDAAPCGLPRAEVGPPCIHPRRRPGARRQRTARDGAAQRHRLITASERAPAHVVTADRPGHPGMTPAAARDPVPPDARTVVPAAVVVHGPAPRLGRHPGPAVVRPHPTATPVGTPPRGDVGPPDVT